MRKPPLRAPRGPEPEQGDPGLADAAADRPRRGARHGVPPREAWHPGDAVQEHGRRRLRRAAATATAREPQVREHPPRRQAGAAHRGLRLLPSRQRAAAVAGHVLVPGAGGRGRAAAAAAAARARVGQVRRVLLRRGAPGAGHGEVPLAVPHQRARRHRRRELGGRGGHRGQRARDPRPRHRLHRRGLRRAAGAYRRRVHRSRAGEPAQHGGGGEDGGGGGRRVVTKNARWCSRGILTG